MFIVVKYIDDCVHGKSDFHTMDEAISEVEYMAAEDSEPYYSFKIVDMSKIDSVIINRPGRHNSDRIVINL